MANKKNKIEKFKSLLNEKKETLLNSGIIEHREDLTISSDDLADESDLANSVINQSITTNIRDREVHDLKMIEDHDECSLAFLPWAHVFGGCIELNALIAHNGKIAICDDTKRLLEYLPEVKPTLLFAVPRIWNRIYDGVQKQVASKPGLIRAIFHHAMSGKSNIIGTSNAIL